jgi:hypothetical protein
VKGAGEITLSIMPLALLAAWKSDISKAWMTIEIVKFDVKGSEKNGTAPAIPTIPNHT